MCSIDFLEYLTLKTGCFCMSDLHRKPHKGKLKHILEQVPPERCSMEKWIDTPQYATGRGRTAVEKAKEIPLQWINE